jgi:ribosomal protein L37AE/L43A
VEPEFVPPERLACPACHRLTTTRPVYSGIEQVSCEACGKLLRKRAALDPQQRAQAMILRWAVQQMEATMKTRHRRKPRGGSDEVFKQGMARVLDQLLAWSRLIHKVPPLREP